MARSYLIRWAEDMPRGVLEIKEAWNNGLARPGVMRAALEAGWTACTTGASHAKFVGRECSMMSGG